MDKIQFVVIYNDVVKYAAQLQQQELSDSIVALFNHIVTNCFPDYDMRNFNVYAYNSDTQKLTFFRDKKEALDYFVTIGILEECYISAKNYFSKLVGFDYESRWGLTDISTNTKVVSCYRLTSKGNKIVKWCIEKDLEHLSRGYLFLRNELASYGCDPDINSEILEIKSLILKFKETLLNYRKNRLSSIGVCNGGAIAGIYLKTVAQIYSERIERLFYCSKELNEFIEKEHRKHSEKMIINNDIEKTLHNESISQVKENVLDVKVYGDGDLFQLISKASSKGEGWMKSTKAMEIHNHGCVVQVTTQQGDNVAEALTFVPDVKIVVDDNGNKKLAKIVW